MTVNNQSQKVRFFEALCSDCKESFSVPLLSDFSYGEFILKSEDGKAFVYMNSVTEKNFDAISSLFKEFDSIENIQESPRVSFRFLKAFFTHLKQKGRKEYFDTTTERLHWVIAQCADDIDGRKLTNQFRCPNCHSTNVLYGDSVVVKDDLIPIVSFDNFTALSESEKKVKVGELYNASKDIFQALDL